MSESAHVSPGSAPWVCELAPDLALTKVSVGDMDNNAYLLESRGEVLLIDAAAEPERLLALLGARPLRTIVTTHRHHDHIGGLATVARATDAKLLAGTPDAEAIAKGAGVTPHGIWDGDRIDIGSASLEVIGLVGHTPGSITVAHAPEGGPVTLFTGDSLFPGGPGKTWKPADFTSLMDDLEVKIFDRFGDDTIVHPGHGDSTTLGAERPQLPEWRARGW